MPTYDYVCESCEHRFELFQQMSAPHERACPECGKDSLKRLVGTGAGVLFKGSGFYETDYRSDSYKKAAESEKKSKEPDSSSSAGTPDAPKSGKSESSGNNPSSSGDSSQ